MSQANVSSGDTRKLSIPTMFFFGIGQAAGSFKNMAWGVLLLFSNETAGFDHVRLAMPCGEDQHV